MSADFIARLSALSDRELLRQTAASEDELREIEERNHIVLPADVREALAFSNGFAIQHTKTHFNFYDAGDLAWTSSEPHFVEGLPGMWILGDDGGGSVYYADPQNSLGRGPFAVFLVRMGDMYIDHSMFVAPSFGEAVNAVLDNVDFFKRPELRHGG
jgi:hypothetical protein